MSYEILRGDCLTVLRTLPDNSFDSIVTDPPYELGFMGKAWDASGIANNVEMWREALRVLKPGGHLLAFSGSRTYHRMTCAIEDAGFDIRDQIMWVYGSGFPKSLDVSKAIDKANGNPLAFRMFADAYAAAIAASNLTHADIDRALGVKSSSCYWARSDHRGGMPPRHHWEQVGALLPIPAELYALYDEAERLDREVSAPAGNAVFQPTQRVINAGAPVTDAARQWEGWGTALKPAHEPICVARKPLIGTVAANVLAHGVGALNIDDCRVHSDDSAGYAYTVQRMAPGADQNKTGKTHREGVAFEGQTKDGRWPANLIHDGSNEVLAAFPDAKGQQGATAARSQGEVYGTVNAGQIGVEPRTENNTSASRFFMECKSSYNDACPDQNPTLSDALTAALNSPLPSEAVCSVLARVVSAVLPEDLLCADLWQGPSTNVTVSDLETLCKSVTQAMQNIAKKFWQEQKPAKLSLSLNPVNVAVSLEPTGTTRITISHWTSDGSADPVTFNITRQNLEVGVKGFEPFTGASRLMYCAKASKSDRGPGNTHPTVKPLALMRYLLRLVTPPGGRSLDIFAGSGSTIVAGLQEGFVMTGIELTPEYADIAEARAQEEYLGDLI